MNLFLTLPEENISILEHAVFKRDHDELRMFKVSFQHLSDVLSVRQVQSCIHLKL